MITIKSGDSQMKACYWNLSEKIVIKIHREGLIITSFELYWGLSNDNSISVR